MDAFKNKIQDAVDGLKGDIVHISRKIHSRPELLHEEHFAKELLCAFLSGNGFSVSDNPGGLSTAFVAEAGKTTRGPVTAFIAEYDALPKIGHACGHNMIAAMSSAAGVALLRAGLGKKGKIVVVGTPAEEGGGGKITLLENGIFEKIDVAMMAHPSNKNRIISRMLALVEMNITFYGKSAHAAGSPESGVNALDGVILTFNNINALRQQTRDDARIHGVITEGGVAPNIIPNLAKARFFIRAADLDYFKVLVEKVKKCVKGAAQATGCRVKIQLGSMVYHPMRANQTLAAVYKKYLHEAGMDDQLASEQEGIGSSDVGNLSQVLPTIHPEFAIGPENVVNHSSEFAKQAVSEFAHNRAVKITQVLALTGAEVLLSAKLLKAIKKEFREKIQ
ncbi:MAG: M20 family metallopeptidase [Nitrospinota bacterium]